MALGLLGLIEAVAASPTTVGKNYADRAHDRALASFRQGRFPEAYGRFVDLAEAGHAPSARYALWMCEHGPALFGSDWDCASHQVQDWARAAGVNSPRIEARNYRAAQPMPTVTPVRR